MNSFLVLFGFDRRNHIETLTKLGQEVNRLFFARFNFVVDMNVWRSIENQTIQQAIKTRHEANHGNKHPNTESHTQSRNARLFNSRKQVSSSNIQYDAVIRQRIMGFLE